MRIVYLALILILSPKVNSISSKPFSGRFKHVHDHTENPHEDMNHPSISQKIGDAAKSIVAAVGEIFIPETDLQQHNVKTKDGYILTVFRIPSQSNGKPVLIQHGLLQSSRDWLITGKEKSLGIYDIPAVITYITDLTRQHLFYIGHSMGGTTFSVMALERPDVAKKVTAAFLLAPGTCGHKITSFLKYLAPFWESFQKITDSLGLYEFLPHYGVLDIFGNTICHLPFLRKLCQIPLSILAGENRDKLDDSLLPEIWRTFPAGTSSKLFTHYLQLKDSKKFRKFDYGPETNLKIYNNLEPPTFDLSRLYVNVTVFWSPNDRMVVPDDIATFYKQIPIKGGLYKIKDEKYNHFDFLWAKDAPELVYSKIIEKMRSYK